MSRTAVVSCIVIASVGAVALWVVQRRLEGANVQRSAIRLRELLAGEVVQASSQNPDVANIRFNLSEANDGYVVTLANTSEKDLLVVPPSSDSISLHFYDSGGTQIDLRGETISAISVPQRDPKWRNEYGYNSIVPLRAGQKLTTSISCDRIDIDYDNLGRASFIVARYIPSADVAEAERKLCDLVTVALPSNPVKLY